MFSLSDQSRSRSESAASGYFADLEPTFERERIKELIDKANKAPLLVIFKYYHLGIDQYNRKITCPFPKHKGGRENSASFWYYPETNSFWCFGCKTGCLPVDFIEHKEEVSRNKAAQRALEITAGEEMIEGLLPINQLERTQLILDFSKSCRIQMINYQDNADKLRLIEKITLVFDQMNAKYKLDNEALRLLVSRLKEQICSI
jgi:hypothetical protein